MTTLFLGLLSFLKFSAPQSVENNEWKRLSLQLKRALAPLHYHISRCTNPEDLKILGNRATEETVKFCTENKELFQEDTNVASEKFKNHQNKTIAELEATKKSLEKRLSKLGQIQQRKNSSMNAVRLLVI